jgi:hypothetical protein
MSVRDTARTARAVLDITAGLENSTAMALDVPLAVDVAVEEADAVAVTLEVEVEDDVEVELELEVAVGVVDGTWLCKNTALMSWAADTMSARPAQRGAGAMQQ